MGSSSSSSPPSAAKVKCCAAGLNKFDIVSAGASLDWPEAETEEAERFLESQWPELCGGGDGGGVTVFIPECFISKQPHIIEADIGEWPKPLKKKLEKGKKPIADDLRGDVTERHAFEQLRKFFFGEKKDEKIVVFHGWQDRLKDGNSKEVEADFIIIIPSCKTIVYLEAKATATKSAVTSAVRQHFALLEVFKSISAAKGWKFVKSIYFDNMTNDELPTETCCDDCKKFILTQSSDVAYMKAWCTSCTSSATAASAADENNFRDLVKRLVYAMHAFSKTSVVTRSQVSRKIRVDLDQKVGSNDNILLWTKSQYAIFHGDNERVMFTSAYGTGKTVLLWQKCVETAQKDTGKKVYYIICPGFGISSIPTLLMREKKYLLKKLNLANNMEVLDLLDINDELSKGESTTEKFKVLWGNGMEINKMKLLHEFMSRKHKENNSAGFFLDELDPYEEFSLDKLFRSGYGLEEYKGFLWIAFAQPIGPALLKNLNREMGNYNFVMPELKENLRNTANVFRQAYQLSPDAEGPTTKLKIEGPAASVLKPVYKYDQNIQKVCKERLEEALKILPDLDDLLVAVPGHGILPFLKKTVQDLCKEKKKETYYSVHYVASENIDEFFKKKRKGVMIADHEIVAGSEFKSVIAFIPKSFSNKQRDENPRVSSLNVILRCVSNLIVIEYYATGTAPQPVDDAA